MSARLLSSLCGCGHQTHSAVHSRSQNHDSLAQLFLQLIAQLPKTVHIHIFKLGGQKLHAPDLLHLIHYISQSILGKLAL